MNAEHIYETETMAELCARQGRVGEAIAIYHQLLEATSDPTARSRFRARVAVLEASWRPVQEVSPADVPLPEPPGASVHVVDDQVTVAWALPPGVVAPTLEVLVLQRTAAGIEAHKRTMPLTAPSGRLALAAPAVHSALAAVGLLAEGRFVPLARSRQ